MSTVIGKKYNKLDAIRISKKSWLAKGSAAIIPLPPPPPIGHPMDTEWLGVIYETSYIHLRGGKTGQNTCVEGGRGVNR